MYYIWLYKYLLMKKIYFLIIALFFFNGLSAQVIDFPDENFKEELLRANDIGYSTAEDKFGNFIKIDSNNDGEIDRNEASRVVKLHAGNASITSLEGISYFFNLSYLYCSFSSISKLELSSLNKLEELYCNDNQLTSLDVTALKNLKTLYVSNNQITTLNFDGLINLEFLMFDGNKMKSLDISSFPNLIGVACGRNELASIKVGSLKEMLFLYCSDNLLTTLDLSGLPKLDSFECGNNQLLTSLFLKNGINEKYMTFNDTPNLEYICIDESQFSEVQNLVSQYNYANCQINSYCSFDPGGINFTIQGNCRMDNDRNGCDVSDISTSKIKFTISDGIETGSLITNETGNYLVKLKGGSYTITPKLENDEYFTVSPASINVDLSTTEDFFIQNFCITPIAIHNDLEITLIPLEAARPGFDTKYKLIYKNKGNTVQSGIVNLTFEDIVLDVVTSNPVISNQNENDLSWDFTNLKPFETREIALTLNLNGPMEIPAVVNGAILRYKASINTVDTDENTNDNTFYFDHTVVGSLDPNNKTCLEGDIITPSLIGEYVHYLIRFENTGTYPAQNIVVKDMIDLSKFDISTLIPTSSSHSFVTKISEGNKVEFTFENINLPFDDANNDGYIAFKIKTKPTLVVGDSFDNEANIYFDYNFPVLTNKATSKFGTTLGTQDFEFSNYFKMYPNPANEVLNILETKDIEIKSIAVYDILGQLVIALPNINNPSKIDVSNLSSGNYFLKIKSDKGNSSLKFIKN